MADLNEVRLIGRLTRDPELRTISTGQMICTFGLATGRKYQVNNEWKEETTFVDITAWAKTAENVNRYCKKGKLVFVGGRLKLDSWQDKQTGEKKQKLSVVADNVQFLERPETQQQHQENQDAEPLAPTPISPAIKQQAQTQNKWTPNAWNEPDLGQPPF